jgi:poly-gamma-glutamate synthesis protein (capsule biosynthesis protein)
MFNRKCLLSFAVVLLITTVWAAPSNNGVLTIAIAGDLMLNGIHSEGSKNFLSSVAPIFKNADVAFANLETPLTLRGTQTPRKSAEELHKRSQYILRGKPFCAKQIAEAGIDIVSCANNHMMDWGLVGMRDTLSSLDKVKVKHSGVGGTWQAACEPAIVTSKGIRIAFLSYLAFRGSSALRTCTPAQKATAGIAVIPCDGSTITPEGLSVLQNDISNARSRAELVFVSFHWGNQGEPQPTVYQKALGRKAIDLGADMVIGHHPHVLQPTETYKGKPIFYSLGNFVAPNCRGRLGETLIAVTSWQGRKLTNISLHPVRIVGGLPKLVDRSSFKQKLRKSH